MRSPATNPWVRGVVPPTVRRCRRCSARSTDDVGWSTTRAALPEKTTSDTLSRRRYASRSSESTAPLVACMRCSASIDALASTTKTMSVPVRRRRTFCRRSWRSRCSAGPILPAGSSARRRTWWGAAARIVASNAMSVVFSVWVARTYRPRLSLLCEELRFPLVALLRRSRGSAILRTGKISPSKSCSALRRVTAWVAWSLPCTWPGLSPSSPLPESSGGWSPVSAVCSEMTAASASWAISSMRSRARSAAAPPGWATPS